MARLKVVRVSALEELLALQLRGAGLLPRAVRELRFAPPRRFRFDFAFPHAMLAVECEGGVWARGRHNRGAGFEMDTDKYNLAVERGWRVLRYTMSQIKSGEALAQTERVLKWEELKQSGYRS